MTNVYFNLIQREEMARNLWCKRSNTTGNSVSVDSSTDGGTTLAEYPGNHPVITQLSPRNHPLLDAIWKHVAMIFAVLVMSMANVGLAWGANTPAAAGTYTLTSSNKPGSENKFYKLGNGVYIHRRNNSSQDNNGLKAKSDNTNGIAVYVNSSMNLSCSIYKASSTAAQTVGINVYTLSNGSTTFDSFESGTDNSTTVSVTLSASATYTTSVSFAAAGSKTTETKSSSNITLAAGYYYIVPAETTSEGKTYLKSITLSSAASCDSNPANPGGLAVGNITAGGATFTITDAANTNNYEIVCKTTSGAPAADATPTQTGTSKTIVVATGLTESTTYYAFVRSVCDASHKSSWVALGSGTFTTKSCSISSCGNATLTYPIYTSGDLTTSNLFSGASSTNATAVSVGASPAFTGVTVSAAKKGSAANEGACYAKGTALTGKMQYSTSSKSSSYYIDFPFTVNTGYTFTPCDVQVVIQPVSSNQAFTVEITNGTNVYGTSTATLNAGVMEPIIGLTSTAEMSAGNYAVRLYPHGGSSKEFRMGANVILKGTTAAVASDAYGIYIGKNNDNYTLENLTNTSGSTWSKTITLDASSYYEFKVKKTPSAGDAVWYGNNGKITATTSPAWDFNTSDGNCKLYTTVAGSYTFSWDASTNKLTITYPAGDHPTKRIYMACGSGTWCDATPKFFVHSWGVTDYNTQVQQNACGEYYADIIWYNDYFQFTRNNSTATAYDDQNWNYSQDLTYNSSQLLWTFSGWDGSTGNFSSSAYTPTTYTISYATGSTTATGGAAISGSKADESKTCGVAFTLPSSAVFTATGYTQVGWTTSDGGSKEYELGGTYITNAAQTFYPVWEVAASLTALECNTLYKVDAMVPASITLTGEGQYGAGLSANTKFEVLGDPSKTDQAGGAPEMKNEEATINTIVFPARMYLKRASNLSEGIPTSHAVKFIVGESGVLDVYAHRLDRIYLKKAGGDATQFGTSTSTTPTMVTFNVTAGTYYIYSTGGSTCVYGVRLNCCTTPAAPTAFAAGSITSTGATFTITDAAGAASYDIYYSTSGTAPTASTPATTTSTEKTKAVTGLTASTTYYAWVRSVCDADHKSAWVALSGSSFETSAAAVADGCWDPENTASDQLTNGDVTLTTFENDFSGIAGITSVTINSKGTDTGQCSGSDKSDGYLKVKNAQSAGTKIITIVITTAKDITIGGKKYGSNTGSFYLVKSTDESTKLAECDTDDEDEATNCPAGTYYVYAKASNKSITFSKLCISDAAPDVTAPTFVSSVPANGATGVATSGTIVLTFSEPLGSVDASKFTLTGATKGTVTIDGSDATKVNIPYSGAENSSTVTLATAAAAVSDLAGNTLAAALSNISFTTAAAAPAGDCITIAYFDASQGSSSSNKPDNAGKYLYGYTNSAKTEAYAYTITTGSTNNKGQGTGASDYLRMDYGTTVNIYADNTTTGGTPATFSNVTSVSVDFKMNKSSYYTTFDIFVGSTRIANNVSLEGAAQSAFTTFTYNNLEQLNGKISIVNKGSGSTSFNFHIDNIQICTSSLPACTTPVLPTLSNQSLCEGGNATAWTATITNSLATGESVAYSWTKKGSSTVLSSTATYQPTSVTEAMAGTYVVTATVSADGKASKSATKEVTLTVNEATEVTAITADKATVYPTNSVTLTATANMDATWQWYTCTNAEGDGEVIISEATSASYTIASAGVASTYYYKAVATGSCGTAERVYALTVSAAAGGDCETEFWFAKAADKPASATAATHITGTPSGSSGVTYTATIDGNSYPITGSTGQKTGNVTIIVPEDNEGTLYVVVAGSSNRTITLSKGVEQVGQETPANSTWGTFTFDGLDAGTYTLVSSGNISWGIIALKLCSGEACTDPEVTASVNNSTACVGSSVTFTATGAHASATYQWQKYSGGAWTDIASATAATYNIDPVATTDALKYRVIASHACDRTSNEVTLNVPVAPVFADFTATRSVMTTSSLSITDVEASDATSYIWYKSANNTFEPGTDAQVGTSKDLIIGAVSEAANSTFYLFCVASNSCGSTTSGAITVNVTAFVEEECATRGNEGSAEFGFSNTGMSSGTYDSKNVWYKNSNSNYLTYSAPEGKYLATAKVTIASSNSSNASYQYSTNNGTSWSSGVTISGLTTSLTEKTINLPANVTDFRIGRNLDGAGESSGTFYLHKACFIYAESCTATTVTPSATSKTYEMGGEWSNPTFTLSVAGTLTYSSSNEDIASVDDDGTVTFNGEAGTVTITASYAGDETYCASTGSYTITVSCPGGAPKVEADGTTDMSGCNSSVTLHAKKQDGTAFADGTYQWFRNGEEIDGATSSSYTARQAGTYTVARTNGTGCTSPSTNSAIVTSETTEPEVERLVPFQYYHVDKTYSDQMKMRHLFAVKNSGTLDGKHFKMYVSRNGGAATDVTSSNALVVVPNGDGHVDTVMVDLNKLSGKYSENDEVVYTCKAIDCSGNVSDVYKNTITMRVIDATPTLALIISSDSVGDDFFRYKAENLQEQTGGSAWSGEWPLYTYLKTRYNITPVNGYADFYKYNYEPFDILLLTDFPKTKPYGDPENDNQKKQNTLARKALDDMADLCDFRPLLSFKTHMVQEEKDLGHVSKWQAKGFTSNAVVPNTCQLRADIVCYAHPMFASLSTASSEINENKDNEAQKVFTLLSGEGYESGKKVDGKKPKKGIQGFEVAAADNFVIIAYSHFDATATDLTGADAGKVHWEDKGKDRNLVAMCERQANIEARMILFSLNAGAHSKLTNAGMAVVDSCLQYLLDSDPLHVSDCSLVFDNNEGNGDGNWNTATNWLPTREEIPHANLAAHIKAPCTVNISNASALNIRIEDEGSLIIPQGAALMVVNTIKRQDGRELSPTEVGDIHIGSSASGNGTLIFNNNDGDTKARVDMYSTAKADTEHMNAGTSTWQYIGTPHNDIGNAQRNYYDSWLYQQKSTYVGWEAIPNGGPLVPFRGYCVTHPAAPVVFDMEGTLVATTSYDISVPENKYVVAANSWVAPIDINAITDDDMEGFSDRAIYFFNTGSDTTGTGELNGGDRWAAGTYVSVPIHSAPYTGDDHIPSMQGFYVWSETAGTLHLDYEKHVRGTTRDNILSGRMHAPRRAVAENSEPNVLKIFARGSRYDDRLIVLEREDFTRRYESGWDGEAWGGSDLSPMVYITNEAGVDEAVSAIPEFEGTVVTFKAGEDNDYHFDFIYDGEESLYLFDTENSTYTQIMTGESYYFSTDDKAPHSRFILTRRGPQIATGVGEVPSDQVQGTKAKKLLIENKMYILLNGALYDATGKAVK